MVTHRGQRAQMRSAFSGASAQRPLCVLRAGQSMRSVAVEGPHMCNVGRKGARMVGIPCSGLSAPERPPIAWLFDVDGVLTSPELKRITQPGLYKELIKRLRRGEPVGLNTGRSLSFLTELLHPLEVQLIDKRLLRYVVALGEKGGVRLDYGLSGEHVPDVDSSIDIPKDLQAQVRALADESRFSICMFFDRTKQTMISLELREGCLIEEFESRQREVVDRLRALLERGNWHKQFSIDPTRIATDVQHTYVGKALGTLKFVKWLETRGINPVRYVCFGDSSSDYEMLEQLLQLGKQAQLVFVGEKHLLHGKDTRFVTFTHLPCDQGTLSYLQSL